MALCVSDLSYSISHKSLIKGISFSLSPSHLYGIIGPNGSGKSTLLKTIARIYSPSSGNISWNGKNLLQASRFEISRLLSLVPQNPEVHFDFTVAEMTAMGCYPLQTISSEVLKIRVQNALSNVNACHLQERLFSTLSGGEKQRVYIARSLATEAPVLLLDEPTSHLDPKHKLETWQYLKSCTRQGKLVTVATHDLHMAKYFCDQLIVLNEGECIMQGESHKILSSDTLYEIFGLKSIRELLT